MGFFLLLEVFDSGFQIKQHKGKKNLCQCSLLCWVKQDLRMNHIWCHLKCVIGALTTHVTGTEMNELERSYHGTKPNEDFIFKIGQCWQHNKYPDGNWKILIVTLIISNIWVCVVIEMKHLDAFVTFHLCLGCTVTTTSGLCELIPSILSTFEHFFLYILHFPA